jgi:hypothetical protein
MKVYIDNDISQFRQLCPCKFDWKFDKSLNAYIEVDEGFVRDLLFYLSGSEQTNFTTILIQLIFKADNSNLAKLSEVFPTECAIIWAYKNIPDFYKKLVPDENTTKG